MFRCSGSDSINDIVQDLRLALNESGAMGLAKSFWWGKYPHPVRFLEPVLVAGPWIKIEVDLPNLPRGVFPEDLFSDEVLTLLRERLGRHVDYRYQRAGLHLDDGEIASGVSDQFWYYLERSSDLVRGIPRVVPFSADYPLSGDSPLIYFGQSRYAPVYRNLYPLVALLVGGASRQGKSVFLNHLIASLALNYSPSELLFYLVDFKGGVELGLWAGLPHVSSDVCFDDLSFRRLFDFLAYEYSRRLDLFRGFARDIREYNSISGDKLPYIVVVIDEFAAVVSGPKKHRDEITDLVAGAAARYAGTGIHLVLATQRPSVDVVDGRIKANFPTRVAFSVATEIDSTVILDQEGAERLGNPGRFILIDGVDVIEVQSPFIDTDGVRGVIEAVGSSASFNKLDIKRKELTDVFTRSDSNGRPKTQGISKGLAASGVLD